MPKYRVTANALRIRSGPGTNYETVGMLLRNNIVTGDEVVNDWVHITTEDNKTGWSSRRFLELQEELPPPLEVKETYRVVNATSLNLRQGPGTNFALVGSLKQDEVVNGLAVSSDGVWAQVQKANGIQGWASLKYLIRIPPPPIASSAEIQMIVTVDTLNVRSGPGAGDSIISKAHRGDRLHFLGATPGWDWINIKTNDNKTGWCVAKYLKENNDLVAPREDYSATGFHRALTDNLSMREGPDNHYPIVAELTFNRVVMVDRISGDSKWRSDFYPGEGNALIKQIRIICSCCNDEQFLILLVVFDSFRLSSFKPT